MNRTAARASDDVPLVERIKRRCEWVCGILEKVSDDALVPPPTVTVANESKLGGATGVTLLEASEYPP